MMHKQSFVWMDKLTAKILKPKDRAEFQRCGLIAKVLAHQSVLKNSFEPKAIQRIFCISTHTSRKTILSLL